MGVDKIGVKRGNFTVCNEEFESHDSITCEYSGHPTIEHVQIDTTAPIKLNTCAPAENYESKMKRIKIEMEI